VSEVGYASDLWVWLSSCTIRAGRDFVWVNRDPPRLLFVSLPISFISTTFSSSSSSSYSSSPSSHHSAVTPRIELSHSRPVSVHCLLSGSYYMLTSRFPSTNQPRCNFTFTTTNWIHHWWHVCINKHANSNGFSSKEHFQGTFHPEIHIDFRQ